MTTPLSPQGQTTPLNPNTLPLPPAAVGELAVGGYEILGELSRGGMGVVYTARQLGANRLVALKMILSGAHAGPEELARFRTEAEAVARLRHPNIVQVYQVGEQDGQPFYTMEFVEGGSLEQQLRHGPLPADRAAGLVAAIARALDAAHQARVVHRDLKPANVLLTGDGTPKVTDFGLAKLLDHSAGQTQTGVIVGTPRYMAPEQAAGKNREVGPAADVYSLGAILYEALTGQPPFQADTPLDLVRRVVSEEPVSPRRRHPGVPRELEAVCLKCLEKEPARRYPRAADLAEDLERYLRGEPVGARPPHPGRRLMQWARRQPALAATLAALAIFYTNHLAARSAWDGPDEGDGFHRFVTALVLVWCAGAGFFQWILLRPRWTRTATLAWVTMEVILFTALLYRGSGPQSSLVTCYLLLLGGAALRAEVAVLWLATALCVSSYVGLAWNAYWHRPDLTVYPRESLMFLLTLGTMALILDLLLRRARAGVQPGPTAGDRA